MQNITVNVTIRMAEYLTKTTSDPNIQFTIKTDKAAYTNPTKNISHGLLSDLMGFNNISSILLKTY